MLQFSSELRRDEYHLGSLAMRFRSKRGEDDRHAIAEEYARTVDRLIRSGHWQECPAPEDQLPDEWMPKSFADYWFDEMDL